MTFEANRGQFAEKVLFRTRSGGATVWFCRDGIYYQFTHHAESSAMPPHDLLRRLDAMNPVSAARRPDSIQMVVVKAAFVQANPAVEIGGEDLLTYRSNYFLGNDPSRWRTDVLNYAGVIYRNLYPGIDVRFTGEGGRLVTRRTARSGADLSQVQFQYEGNAEVTTVAGGGLSVAAPWGTVLLSAPVLQDGMATAEAPSGVVAPPEASSSATTLVYSTFLGGSGDDYGYSIAVDAAGSAYVVGSTLSVDFPTQNPYDGSYNGDYHGDAFVTKLSPTGNALVYSTFLGGGYGDYGASIVVDASGSAYVTGGTYSLDFPTQNPYDGSVNGDRDVFVARLSAAGNALMYSTFLGGSGSDEGISIAVDTSGNAYVTGETYSSEFPTQDPYDSSLDGVVDAFVTKLSAAGNALVYSTFLGGSDNDAGFGIAVDLAGSAYVTGLTLSSDYPTQNPYDGSLGALGFYDAFVTKLSAAGNDLVYSTFLGGSDLDLGSSIAVDRSGSAYVTGETRAYDFPTQNPYDGSLGGPYDAFVTKLSAAGNDLVYSTFLGGSAIDRGYGIAVDTAGSAYVTGYTYSSDFPTQNPYDGSYNGATDAFVTRLSFTGSALVYSTFLGGGSYDGGNGIVADASGSAYVTGSTYSTDFPTRNAYDSSFNWHNDAFIAKLGPCACPCHGDPKCDGQTDVLDVVGVINVAFRGVTEQGDSFCPKAREDVDCSGSVDILDVTHMINVAFRGMDPATQFCNPCPGFDLSNPSW